MLIRNFDVTDGFVNGELGKVVDFIDSNQPGNNPRAVLI